MRLASVPHLRVSLALLAGVALLSGGARAQVTIIDDEGNEITFMEGFAGLPGMLPQAPVKAETAPAKPSPRLEKLKKLEFDRRPSAILAAWSTPPKPKGDAESKPADSAPAAAESQPVNLDVTALAALGYASGSSEVNVAPAAGSQPAAETAPDPEAAEKLAEAEAAKKKTEEDAARATAETKAIDEEMAALQRNVTLGDWVAVKTYLAGLTEDERKGGYERLLQSLQQGPSHKPNVHPFGQAYIEKNRLAPEDVLGLAAAMPPKLSKENLTALGKLLRQALDAGHQIESFLQQVRPRLDEPDFAFDRRQLALLLVNADQPLGLEGLLPSADEAEQKNDREGLNLLSRYCLAQYDKEKKVVWLEQAWRVTQAVLAVGEVDETAKGEALKRAVDIAPKIQKELGQAWLDESFTARPDRGMEILAAIGSASSTALSTDPLDEDKRFKLLELQTTAAKALLAASPERASEWKSELGLLAGNWLREAQFTYQYDDSTTLGPRMQRDPWGNFFYNDWNSMRRGNTPTPIRTDKILDIRPGGDWLAHIEATLEPRFQMIYAQLLLKVGEEEQAFPCIEQLAVALPRQTKELADEFLRVWTKNHDPNSEQKRTNPYMFMYGFEERANGIPLTRSKQERNLAELGKWVARLRSLKVDVSVELMTTAFTSAHSTAEVYRLETVEGIFGPLKDLEPATLAELVQKMRTNLTGLWRDAAVQKDKKTNRRQQDIQAEVLRGYELAHGTLARALDDHPGSWELWLAQAAIDHDENNYRNESKKEPGFSARREAAFETFAKAGALYAATVEALDKEKETTKAFELWFYAALGACDLKFIDQDKVLAPRQIPLIQAAIAGLPGERAERHTALFANALFTRMSNAAPAVKFRYLREGLAIAGEHKLAREARQVFDYYEDLVTEIELRAELDGGARVGHGQPFGLQVDIRHTREIERESGGFSKYLQNQNNAAFGWNYGRPLEDYRDKFEQAAREALKEHFYVRSVTFNDPQAKSKADSEYGWRITPYAYLLLVPRGPQVDRVPPLRLDLDFLDTSGYAIIPVESAAVLIDAKEKEGEERPFEKLNLTQTLDERQAKDGKLLLEVKGTALGLVPELGSLLDLSPEGFEIASTDDHGVSVVKFDEEGQGIDSERTWTVALRAKPDLVSPPESFTFGKPKVETAASEQFRYVDADLAKVEPTVALERQYGKPSRAWMWWSAALALAGAGAFVGWRKLQRPKTKVAERFQMPDPLTPFSVLGWLREIEHANGASPLSADERRELSTEIESLERHFFVEEAGQAPDLRRIAENWARRTA